MRTGTKRVLVQGLVAGFIGYAAVAVFFFMANLIAGRPPFYTVAVPPVATIAAASLLAATAMAACLRRVHPQLRRAFREYEDQPPR